MARYAYHRIDANAADLYAFLEAHGATVQRIGKPLDALVAYRGMTALVEVKTKTGKLRPGQAKFLEDWPGLARVLRDEAGCQELLYVMRTGR